MATVPAAEPTPIHERFLFRAVGWEGYQSLRKLVGDRPVHLTYDRGNVEIMSPLPVHELYRRLLGYMVEALTDELDIPRMVAGSTTFHRRDLDRGLEPDECFYLASAGRVRDRKQIDLRIDPPPDLAIEIDITSSSLDRLGIYAALGVPEVWRFDGETLSVLVLQTDGKYVESSTSKAFPFLPMDAIVRFLIEHDETNDTRWARSFRAWVREAIVPKVRDSAE